MLLAASSGREGSAQGDTPSPCRWDQTHPDLKAKMYNNVLCVPSPRHSPPSQGRLCTERNGVRCRVQRRLGSRPRGGPAEERVGDPAGD